MTQPTRHTVTTKRHFESDQKAAGPKASVGRPSNKANTVMEPHRRAFVVESQIELGGGSGSSVIWSVDMSIKVYEDSVEESLICRYPEKD